MNKYKTLPLGALCATIAALATNEFVRHKSPDFTTHKLGKSPDYIP